MQDIDIHWVIKAQQGDPNSFTQIITQFEKPVYNLCYRMLGNAEDAEDAAQETFLRAYKSMKKYDRTRPFGTWLLSIAAHYCIDQIRKRRYPVVSIEDLPVPDLPDHAPGMDSKMELKEGQTQVRALLKTLDPVDRAAIIMYYWYDMSYDEICESLNMTNSALKSRLHRSRKVMSLQWQKSQPEPAIRERVFHESPTF